MKLFFYTFFTFLLIGSSVQAQLAEKAAPGNFTDPVSNNNILPTTGDVEFDFDITPTPDQTSQAAGVETTNITDMKGAIIGGTPDFQTVSQASLPDDEALVASKKNVFFIKRSNNKNEVHYDANLTKDCTFKKNDPIDHYWRNLKEGQDDISEILSFEERAYGFTYERKNDTEITIIHVGIPNHPITVNLSQDNSGCKVSATVQIKNQTAQFRSVYVDLNANETGADYAYILGNSNGKRIHESYIPEPDLVNSAINFFLSPPPPDKPSTPDSSYWKSGADVMGRPY